MDSQPFDFEGTTTLDEFEARYCTDVHRCVDGSVIKTPNGKHEAAIYRADRASVQCLRRSVALVGLGHPSKYSRRVVWSNVIARSRDVIAEALAQ